MTLSALAWKLLALVRVNVSVAFTIAVVSEEPLVLRAAFAIAVRPAPSALFHNGWNSQNPESIPPVPLALEVGDVDALAVIRFDFDKHQIGAVTREDDVDCFFHASTFCCSS